MKITKSGKKITQLNANKMLANIGCNVCPCCGETENALKYISEGIYNKGIFSGITRTFTKGSIIKLKIMEVDCYRCETCGAEWESDPYEVAR